MELAVRAAFWLTRYSALQKSSRLDTRFADQLLRDMIKSEHGIHVLYQAITDGRAGRQPSRVRADGTAERPVNGQTDIDDRWLRQSFLPQSDNDAGDIEPGALALASERNPHEVLTERILALLREAEGLEVRLQGLRTIEDPPGTALVEVEGCPGDTADDIRAALQGVSDEVVRLKTIWYQRGIGSR
jgi:hypothetical protein